MRNCTISRDKLTLAPVTNNVIKNIRRENLIVNQYEYLLAGPGTHNYDNVIIDNYVAEDGSFARIYDGSSQPQAAWMAAWMAESTVTPWGTFSNSDVLGWYGGDGAMNVWYHNCDPSGPQDWCPPGWDPSSGLCCFLSSPPFPPQEIYDGGANILRGRLQKLYGIVGD